MHAKLPAWLIFPIASSLAVINTVLHSLLLFPLVLVKALVVHKRARQVLSKALVAIANSWVAFNSNMFDWLTPTKFIITGAEHLQTDARYLILANHQSWVDIPVMQKVLSGRAPLLRFFLKSSLIWVPILGLAWWALDFPFMKRYSAAQLKKRPYLAGKDLQATRAACLKFRQVPVSLVNFIEGTRFTTDKKAIQNSPYQFLLKPKAGGVFYVLSAMGDVLDSILDISIVYSDHSPTMFDLFRGKIRRIRVDIHRIQIPSGFLSSADSSKRRQVEFRDWLNSVWQEKDLRIQQMHAELRD